MAIKTGYLICEAQDKMTMQGLLFKNYAFQNGDSRALNQVPGPV